MGNEAVKESEDKQNKIQLERQTKLEGSSVFELVRRG